MQCNVKAIQSHTLVAVVAVLNVVITHRLCACRAFFQYNCHIQKSYKPNKIS